MRAVVSNQKATVDKMRRAGPIPIRVHPWLKSLPRQCLKKFGHWQFAAGN
jgi:hypothetical protein